jgi:pimeloyl-ACP methyl ester carboxylesterase
VIVVQQYSSSVPAGGCSLALRGGRYTNCPVDAAFLNSEQAIQLRIGNNWNGEAGPGAEKAQSTYPITSNSELSDSAGSVDGPSVPHLIVLQHGFLGNSYDMRHLENALNLELPHSVTHTLSIRSNEDVSEQGIVCMADNLVSELNEYVEENMPDLRNATAKGKVSFIGHSMGGVVIRRALEHKSLSWLRHRCHVYMSLATPHLGTQYMTSPLVSTGMWALAAWGKSQSLKELSLSDGLLGDRTRSVLYRLSDNNVLAHFKRVILVSAPEDKYVPLHSASLRLDSHANGSNDSILQQMQRQILAQVPASRLIRITLANIGGEDRNINSFIGRTAHLAYLENGTTAQLLITALVPFFMDDGDSTT